MSAITDFWIEQYRKQRGVSYLGFTKRDGVILHRLSKIYGEKALRLMIKRFLAIEDEPYLRRAGWDTRALESRARGIYVDITKQYGEDAIREANERRESLRQAPAEVLSLLDRIGRDM